MGRAIYRRVFPALISAFVLGALVLAVLTLVMPGREAAEAATGGTTMSLSINGQTGAVEVGYTSVFTVTVHADSIPLPDGYTGVEAWVDFGNTGLAGKKNQESVWPDCDPLAFVANSSPDAEFVGCLSGLASPPPSFYKGSVFTLDVTCDSVFGSVHTIQLLSLGHPVAQGLGAGYVNGLTIYPASHPGDFIADEIQVECGDEPPPSPTPTSTHTPTPCPGGCSPTATFTPTATPTLAPVNGAGMSLSIDGQTGNVAVGQDETFTVIVSADSIPLPGGYTGAQAWVDFGDTGLTPKGNQQAIWPDCDPVTLVSGSVGNAENSGCLTALINPPPSFHMGALMSFDVTCTPDFGTTHTIQLLSLGDPVASTSGAAYYDGSVIPAEHGGDFIADEIQVECIHVLPTPTPPPDSDGDGCSDPAEQQTTPGSETTGGLRSDSNPWDFYDVAIAGGLQGRDQQVDLFNDIQGVIDHYGPTGTEPEYDVWYDRGPSSGPNAWNMTAPDGKIDLFNDIVGVIDQYGHDCR